MFRSYFSEVLEKQKIFRIQYSPTYNWNYQMFFQKQNCIRSQVYSPCKSIKSPSDVYDLVFVFLKSWDKYWLSDIFRDYREVKWVWKGLTLLWRGSLSYRNQSIDFFCKSMDWFLYNRGLRHERINYFELLATGNMFLGPYSLQFGKELHCRCCEKLKP